MRDMEFLNQHRVRSGAMASSPEDGLNGAFTFAFPGEARRVFVIASDQMDWEHVSVSFGPIKATPSWEIMCRIKELFFDDEMTVMQLHPPRSQWISNHAGCLHLWRPLRENIPMPPSVMVGVKEIGELKTPQDHLNALLIARIRASQS